ncbi:serine hydrolase domain-containing protein [Microbacterium hydrocarbonoxydans]|uniref:serine hydrolase domain-containing protein n=1 Tax=Microbacterium hydrocarbonoxydans TaxID=273678 RepID=UPI0007BC54BD|nr:serine hydrolase domain-containing protein [Microbacterium hydrocarbonoxydans]GAT74569.1 putative carboxylesterase [Microbacterium sp. HM58-2]
MSIEIKGTADAGYGRVTDAFTRAFEGREGMGAALTILVDGKPVVDVWGGQAAPGRAWTDDTASVIFSCTKGLMSLLLAQCVERGELGYDDLVAEHWPEYARGGKEGTRIRHLLAHRAGVPALREPLSRDDLTDFARVTAAIERAEPFWAPGTAYAYHPITHGWLVGEIVRRVTGLSVQDAFARALAEPLGVDAWIGIPEHVEERVATMAIGASLADATARLLADENPWPARGMTLGGALPAALVGPDEGFNDPVVRRAIIPGAGGIATARALATIWSAAVTETGGRRLIGDEVRRAATSVQSAGEPFFPAPGPWPAWGMGFQLDSEARRYVTPQGFGHDGAGGQVAFAEPEAKVGFAFLTNAMEAGDDRATAIVDALRDVLG